MLRIRICVLALVLTAPLLPASTANAAGPVRGGSLALRAPAVPAWRGPVQPPRIANGPRGEPRRFRHARNFLGAPSFYPFLPDTETVARPGAEPPAERRAFDPVPVSVGIANPPAASPVIYRIEREKGRPVVRVIRVDGDEPETRAARVARDESGARILTVTPR